MALSSTSNAEHRSNMETSRRAEARPSRKRERAKRLTFLDNLRASSVAHLHDILVDRWRGWRALLPRQDARERFDFARERRVQMPTLDANDHRGIG